MSPGGGSAQPNGPPVAVNQIEIHALAHAHKPTSFDCTDGPLRDFLLTEESTRFDEHRLGYTYLVSVAGTESPVAYFTISSEGLKFARVQREFGDLPVKIGVIPGLKIGRLAVVEGFRFRNIGTHIINFVSVVALDMEAAARVLFVDAYLDSRPFYRKLGFKEIMEANARTALMVFDLKARPGSTLPPPRVSR